jgi:4a-hydroxytetrahydrobiopterin dehydratase
MWEEKDNYLYKQFVFVDFVEAFHFMGKVAALAEEQQHHPDWRNVYNVVEIRLSTHDAGDIVTEKDRKLAEGIDGIVREGI